MASPKSKAALATIHDQKKGVAGVGYEAEDATGVVGRVFMKPFTIVFNYPERRVAFIRQNH